MKYKCIAPFSLEKYDEDGFGTGEVREVKVGEIYENGTESIIGGEVRLNSTVTSKWLEISRDTLNKYFVEVRE